MALNVITAVFDGGSNSVVAAPSPAQWNRGMKLKIEGLTLPVSYQVEYTTSYTRNAIPEIGDATGVDIPNILLQRSAPITACVVLHEGQDDRETKYWITIHITPRKPPETTDPDPEEVDIIDQAIAALQEGVEAAAQSAEDAEAASQAIQEMGVEAETGAAGGSAAVQKVVDPETGAVTLIFTVPPGNDGYSPTIAVESVQGGHRVTVTDAEGSTSFDVTNGQNGRSITGVSMGADYKLTISFSDGTSWTTPSSIRGATGATPDISIGTVTTGAAGSSAAATMTGTAENPVLNLTIPKGDPGEVPAAAIAPTEAGSTAAAAHAEGELFWLSGTLYRATADIAIGDSIVTSGSGANAAAAQIGEALNDLNSALNDLGLSVSNGKLCVTYDSGNT